MANVRQGNIHYVDSTGVLSTTSASIAAVVVTATAANAAVLLTSQDGTKNIADLRVATAGASQLFPFSPSVSGITCPNGLKVQTLTNAIATVIYN